MATTYSISVFSSAPEKTFERLLKVYGECPGAQLRKFIKNEWGDTQQIPVRQTDLAAIIKATTKSEDALCLDSSISLLDGSSHALDLIYYGTSFMGGTSSNTNSNIRIRFSLGTPIRVGMPDVSSIFNKAINDESILHAVGYLETGCPSAAISSIMYHKHSDEYLIDFVRIYADYRLGINGSVLYGDFHQLRHLIAENIRGPNYALVRHFYDEQKNKQPQLLAFLNELSAEEVKIGSMKSLETLLTEKVNDIQYFSFSRVMAASNPLEFLWPKYSDMLQRLIQVN